MTARGQKAGQGGGALAWDTYVDGLVAEHGTLAALAERLAAQRGYREDVESVARALRRLRSRGGEPGGVWGARLLSAFGLPRTVEDRLHFMGQYHSRFVDLPLPLALDLVQLWDRPPTSDSRSGRRWLSLARATLALRARAFDEATAHLDTAAAQGAGEPAAELELALARGVIESRAAPAVEAPALTRAPTLLAALDGPDHDCLHARYVGQLAHALNQRGEIDQALALHTALPDGDAVHPFARSKRANGVAYGQHRRGEAEAALASARRAATFAGDAGHVRLRAMALLMISRIAGATEEGHQARARARAIAEMLAEPTLLARAEAALRDRRSGVVGDAGDSVTRAR